MPNTTSYTSPGGQLAATIAHSRAPFASRTLAFVRRAAGQFAAVVCVGALVVVAVGDAAGRFRIIAAPPHITHTPFHHDDLLIVEPVAALRIKAGDVLIVSDKNEHALLRIDQIVDSEGPQVRVAGDAPGHVRKLDGNAWRVTKSVPVIGLLLRLIAGPIQGALFVLSGLALVVWTELRRGEETPSPSAQLEVTGAMPPTPSSPESASVPIHD